MNDNTDIISQSAPNLSNLTDEALDEILSKNTDNKNTQISNDEKNTLLSEDDIHHNGIDINSIALGYGILLFILVVFIPKIYLANNIYYASKNINYLQAQKESLKNENLELQKSLESTKFNFLTLDIEEIQ